METKTFRYIDMVETKTFRYMLPVLMAIQNNQIAIDMKNWASSLSLDLSGPKDHLNHDTKKYLSIAQTPNPKIQFCIQIAPIP